MKTALDFIVIGAQKSGTTSLYEHLRRHPEITIPDGKELPYFSHESMYRRGWEDYIGKNFAAADPTHRWGTVTPQYLTGGLWDVPNDATGTSYTARTVPERIAAQLPEVRLIAILRDPIARARSHHAMAKMNGLDMRRFEDAVAELLDVRALEQSRREPLESTGYVTWGEYGRLLTAYASVFPPQRLHIVFTEELQRNPAQLLTDLYEFIGVDPDFVPDSLGMHFRAGSTQRRVAWLSTTAPLNPWRMQERLSGARRARTAWHWLPEQRQRAIDRTFARFAYRLDLWNRKPQNRTGDADAPLPAELFVRLESHYARDGALLKKLMARQIPWLGIERCPDTTS